MDPKTLGHMKDSRRGCKGRREPRTSKVGVACMDPPRLDSVLVAQRPSADGAANKGTPRLQGT